MSKYIANSI